MKKLISLLTAILILFSMTAVCAADIDVIVNDNKLSFDVAPLTEEGRTLVPLRAIFESLGADVTWDGTTQTAYSQRESVSVQLTLGSNVMYVNGEAKYLDVPAKAVDGRTLVPVRAIAESYGCNVVWNSALSTVHISDGIKFSNLDIPEYSSMPYSVVNGNIPYFNIQNYTSRSFEMYLPLDNLGRCTYAMAMVGNETFPYGDRESISSVKPSGWQSVTYDVVPGGYLYNRCHLIGYQLSAENANENNLITGTRYLNMDGMLPFENMIADYVKETGNHVLYRVTPVYEGNNLVAKGVLMEAMSYEDKGEGICFNVFCYNVQPGVEINYADGTSWAPGNGTSQTVTIVNSSAGYVLNTNSKKFHIPSCSSVGRMSPKNRADSNLSREEIVYAGYSPCGICKP